jgi:NTP pyrophosphatase (non-canonical NTP hydrolase)
MDVKEFQKMCAGMVERIDRKLNIERDGQLNLAQLLEELGELARAVNSERLRKRKPGMKELEEEFADVFLQLARLADLLGVDLEKAVLDKAETLKKRHGL